MIRTRELLLVHVPQLQSDVIVGPLLLLTKLGPDAAQLKTDVLTLGPREGFLHDFAVEASPHKKGIHRPLDVSILASQRLHLLHV